MEEKKCNICQIIKPLGDYSKSSQHKSGFRNYCKECQNKMSKKYREKMSVELKIKRKTFALENPEKIKEWSKRTYQKHGKRISKERYEKVKSDPIQYLKVLMRRRIRGILQSKNLNKKLPSKDIVGCEYNELKLYLESKFIDGMNWENQGAWHIDHIIPLSSAQTEEEIYKLCHFTNLQPLWALDNIRKSNKIL